MRSAVAELMDKNNAALLEDEEDVVVLQVKRAR
jgi:hypothetical protein